MKLHLLQGSPNCRKTMATAYHLSSDVEMHFMELTSGETKSAEFLAINPNGLTPTLEDGDFKLWESEAVMQYLADCGGGNTLHPRDPKTRADISRWRFWASLTMAEQWVTYCGKNLPEKYLWTKRRIPSLWRTRLFDFIGMRPYWNSIWPTGSIWLPIP